MNGSCGCLHLTSSIQNECRGPSESFHGFCNSGKFSSGEAAPGTLEILGRALNPRNLIKASQIIDPAICMRSRNARKSGADIRCQGNLFTARIIGVALDRAQWRVRTIRIYSDMRRVSLREMSAGFADAISRHLYPELSTCFQCLYVSCGREADNKTTN